MRLTGSTCCSAGAGRPVAATGHSGSTQARQTSCSTAGPVLPTGRTAPDPRRGRPRSVASSSDLCPIRSPLHDHPSLLMFDGLQHLAQTGEFTCVVRCQGSPGRRCHGVTHPGVGPGWQRGHHQVRRCSGSPDTSAPTRTGVPQRRQGCPARPLTQCSAPRRLFPVVTCRAPGVAPSAGGRAPPAPPSRGCRRRPSGSTGCSRAGRRSRWPTGCPVRPGSAGPATPPRAVGEDRAASRSAATAASQSARSGSGPR